MLRWAGGGAHNRTRPPKILKTFLSDELGLQFVSAAGGSLSSKGIYTHLAGMKSSSEQDAWGGVAPPPAPWSQQQRRGSSRSRRQMQPRPSGGGLALYSFDATTGALIKRAPLQAHVAQASLAFLRYV
jgi:hypothetical protein